MSSHDQSFASYRSIVSQVFRLTMAVAEGKHMLAADMFDKFLQTLEEETRTNAKLVSEAQDTITNAFLARDLMRDMFHENTPPTLRIHPDDASAVPESYVDTALLGKGAEIKVMKTEPVIKEDHTVKLNYSNTVSTVPEVHIAKVIGYEPTKVSKHEVVVVEDDEEVEVEEEVVEEEVVEEEVEEEVVEEAEETEGEADEVDEAVAEEEGEAEEEEEEGMEVIKIGKKKYFCGENSKMVYVFINDEEAGDCLGRYENGKIVPL